MQERNLYEYAVIRFVPKVEREEFVNIGLIMMCKRRRWLRMGLCVNFDKIEVMAGGAIDREAVSAQLRGLELVASASRDGGLIATFDTHERFRWLTAVRSACIQTSRPHPGITTANEDLDATFDRLFSELVL